MPLETATYVSDLVATNPVSSDALGGADDHLRLLKATLQATFPGITGAVTATHTELNQLHGGTGTITLTQLNCSIIVGTGNGAGIELGNPLAVNQPVLDFHSSGNNIDYDVRIFFSGGSASIGQGQMNILAANVVYSGNIVCSALSGTTLTLAAAATIATTLSVTGAVALGSTLAVVGAATLGGTVHVTASAGVTIDNALTVGSVGISATLAVAGATSLLSTLAVTGAATLSSTLHLVGAATLDSTLAVAGAATLSSTLAVTGAATFSSTIAVNGNPASQPGKAATITAVTSTGAGTWSKPAGCTWIRVRAVGAGGSSGGTGTGNTGGTTTFNSVNAVGGSGGGAPSGGTPGTGGAGGTGGTGSATWRQAGGAGGTGNGFASASFSLNLNGGAGGVSVFGNGVNSGAGAQGPNSASNTTLGTVGGGGAGEYFELIIANPSSSYSYSVGAGGSAPVGGAAGFNGRLVIEEFYN
jgi:hypothetical protein